MKIPMRAAGIATLFLLGAIPFSQATGQSYPKVMVNGHGLGLTRLAVQERMNGNWVASPSLRPNVDYRLVWRFTNFFPDIVSYGSYVSDVIRISFSAQFGGARFYPSDSYSQVTFGAAEVHWLPKASGNVRPTS
jgi:hypothetical protein